MTLGGCDLATTTLSQPSLARHYELSTLDGVPVARSCCATPPDSGEILAGALEFGDDSGDDEYTWRLTQAHVSGGETRFARVLLSAGRYMQDGDRVTLVDTAGAGTMEGVISGDVLSISTDDHAYELIEWIPTPVGQFIMVACWEAEGGGECVETDSEGTVITVVDGWLYVGPHEGTDAYDLYLDRKYEYRDGTSNVVHSLFSSGTYSWDGETLTFTDESADMGPIMVTLSNLGSKVTLLMQGRVYEFGKLSSLPGGP